MDLGANKYQIEVDDPKLISLCYRESTYYRGIID